MHVGMHYTNEYGVRSLGNLRTHRVLVHVIVKARKYGIARASAI